MGAMVVQNEDRARTVTKIETAFDSVINASIPAHVSSLLQANVDRARSNYDGAVSKFRSYTEVSDMMLQRQQALARQWNARLVENTAENVGAAFDAAAKLAKSKTVPDAANVQAEFLQAQAQRLASQAQDAITLTTKAGMEAFDIWSAILESVSGKAE